MIVFNLLFVYCHYTATSGTFYEFKAKSKAEHERLLSVTVDNGMSLMVINIMLQSEKE